MSPTPVFLPGESRGQRSLAVYGPPGRKESDGIKQFSPQTRVKVVVTENGHGVAALLQAQRWLLRRPGPRRGAGEIRFLACQFQRNVPEENPKACVSRLLPPASLSPSTSHFLQQHCGVGAGITGGETLTEEAGGGTPIPRRPGAQGALRAPPRGPSPVWVQRLASPQEGRLDLYTVASSTERALQGYQRHSWAGTPSQGPQPWQPSLLKLRGCDPSPGHQGLWDRVSVLVLFFQYIWNWSL